MGLPGPYLIIEYNLFIAGLFRAPDTSVTSVSPIMREKRCIVNKMKERMVFGIMIVKVNPPFGCGFMDMMPSFSITCNSPG